MVNHSFECPEGHITEKTVDVNTEGWKQQQCGAECSAIAEHVYLSKRVLRGSGKKITIYRDGAGNVQFPGSADEPMPDRLAGLGYERVQMDYHEARKFQTEFNKAERFKAADKLEFMHYLENEQRKEDRDDLLSALHSMSPRGRDFAQRVINENNARDARAYYSSDPGFYIEAIE